VPDRDVFDRTVGRGWQTASRRMLGCSDDPDALASILRALGTHIKREGSPGIGGIVN